MSRSRMAIGVLLLAGVVGCAVAGPPDPDILARFGPVGLLFAFAVGGLVAFPGMVLVALAGVGWTGSTSVAVCGGGAFLYVTTPFLAGRYLRRDAQAEARPWVERLLRHVHRHPVLVVATLRLVGQLSAPVSYGLAATDIRFRDYLAGSALGLVLPIGLVLAAL